MNTLHRTAEPVTEAIPVAGGAIPDLSVIVPVSERAEPLVALYEEYSAPLRAAGWSFEFVFVAEPWCGELVSPLLPLVPAGEPIRVLTVGQTIGEAALLKVAAERCRAPVVVTLPAYRRIEASALPKLVSQLNSGVDLVVARRWPRRDGWANRLQSSLFHTLLNPITHGRIHDIACGVRVMRREVLREVSLYGDLHRFLPILALREGYEVAEVAAAQHPHEVTTRIYGPGVYLRRLTDVLGLFFLARFTEKPLRFFGLLGALLGGSGILLLAVLLVQRLGGQGIADRPLLLLSSLLVVLSVQLIALGLVGEIIVHFHAPRIRPYRVARGPSEATPAFVDRSGSVHAGNTC